MLKNSEFPLFFQSALAIVGFLLFLSLVSWASHPVKSTLSTPPVASAEIAGNLN